MNWPCTTSSPISSGIPSRLSSTATRCNRLVAAALPGQNRAPPPRRASSAASSKDGFQTICNWASFSAQVIWASRDSGVVID